ncbi:BQ2448_1532 [Microbotryum intermedium]|uniref:BQ2448_1532 protein n=1 Tax=Microbotryum intermedium TaxID=269621 RepID=A0A238FG61_9BASI|nr:BQ2448_1532 [Microbotryum intermedium]
MPRRLSSALSNVLDLPPPQISSSAHPSSSTPNHPSQLGSTTSEDPVPRFGPLRGTVSSSPFASTSHDVYELAPEEWSSLTRSNEGPSSRRNDSTGPGNDGEDADNDDDDVGDGNELPSYTRRAPHLGRVHLPPPRQHVVTSRSKRLKLELRAPGEEHIVLMQSRPGETVKLQGKLIVRATFDLADINTSHSNADDQTLMYVLASFNFPPPKQFHKCGFESRESTAPGHGRSDDLGGRHPVTDEVTIWEDGVELYSSSQALINNQSSDPAKLQGSFEFEFELKIPAKCSGPPKALATSVRTLRPTPPSFVLSTDSDDPRAWGKGAEWAACRYYVKVTASRKGLLTPNDRLIVPIVFVPCQNEPEMSAARTAALSQGLHTPGPAVDPTGWTGKKARRDIRSGMFHATTRSWFEVVLLVPSPSKFARLSVLPFAVMIKSSDPNATTRFPLSSVSVHLVQRAYVGAQGLTNLHDTSVGRPQIEEDGPSEGTPIRRREADIDGSESQAAVWSKRFKGEIDLTRGVASSFRTVNLVIQYLVVVHVQSSPGNECEVAVPISIVSTASILPRARTGSRLSPTRNSMEMHRPAPADMPTSRSPLAAHWGGQSLADAMRTDTARNPPPDLGLPPSYVQSVGLQQ